MNSLTIKNIIRIVYISLFSVMLIACEEDNAENPDTRLSVDKTIITIVRTGTLNTGSEATLTVLANKGYEITSQTEWLSVDQLTGKGKVTVVIVAEENNTGSVREGEIVVKSEERSEIIRVIQNMNEDLDDGKKAGYVYMEENFDWFEEFGGNDQVTYPDQGFTTRVSIHDKAASTFEARGYEDYNPGPDCMYMAKYYLKMGKKNNQTGLSVKLQNIPVGKSSNIKLSFDVAPVIGISTEGDVITVKSIDPTAIVVEKLEGPGSISTHGAALSNPMSMSMVTSWNQWVNMEVNLYGVTSKTKIAIRTSQHGSSGYYRWYLDNVKMEKIKQ
uniref:BACON domain-containing protein n=1 Tax=uncultured Draconibacterium sp. TaxID=1573823 RepID=UPI00321670C4